MEPMKTGSFIRNEREKKGLNQKQFAELLCVSPSTVCKWETGVNLPDVDKMESIAKILEVSIPELLEGNRNLPTINQIDASPSSIWERIPHRTVAMLIAAVPIAAALFLLFFQMRGSRHFEPAFQVVDTYFDDTTDALCRINAFYIIVTFEGEVNDDIISQHADKIRHLYLHAYKEADAIVVMYIDKKYEDYSIYNAEYYVVRLAAPGKIPEGFPPVRQAADTKVSILTAEESSSDDALNIQIVRTAFRYGMWIPEAFFSSHETYMGRDDITYIINLWLNDFLYNRSEDLTTATYIGIVNEFPVIP